MAVCLQFDQRNDISVDLGKCNNSDFYLNAMVSKWLSAKLERKSNYFVTMGNCFT